MNNKITLIAAFIVVTIILALGIISFLSLANGQPSKITNNDTTGITKKPFQ